MGKHDIFNLIFFEVLLHPTLSLEDQLIFFNLSPLSIFHVTKIYFYFPTFFFICFG